MSSTSNTTFTERRHVVRWFVYLLSVFLLFPPVSAQSKADDILLVSVGESASRYSDVAVYLQGLFANTNGYDSVSVEIFENAGIESLADGYYDPNAEDIALRAKVAEGFRYVILIPTIIQTPTGTVEYSEFGGGPTNVYDDAPFDNEYFAPEVFYEGCTQLSKLILGAGSTPMVFLPDNPDEELTTFGPIMYRVANGVGLELIPGAYSLDAAGAFTAEEEAYVYACSIYSQLTELNAGSTGYITSDVSVEDAAVLANVAETTVNTRKTIQHYDSSYENEGAVVYRSLDVTSAPFNDVVRYLYKGSSTQDWTSDALTFIINSNSATTKASRKLGTRNGVYSPGVRFWHPDDIDDQAFKFALEPDQAAFMYVSGSWSGAPAQEVIDLDQENMIPMVFDWIKSFAISPAVSGTASTVDALDYHSCNELYFNYAERGWKLIPLTIGMGRINEAVSGFVASDDALHSSDPLIYMNAYMMLTSALGTQFPLPAEIPAANIKRGSYTTAQIHEACLIGYELIKELAHLSETSAYVPDSDLSIRTDSLPEVAVGEPYSFQLTAVGGDSAYSWELISESGLPDGLQLSSSGLISGTLTEAYGSWNLAFKVTDGSGAFRKLGLKLNAEPPSGDFRLTADVLPLPNNNYGNDTVAVMYSAVQTAPDGLATYRLAISVDPMAGTSITSAGGLWGINSGEGPSGWWNTFDGSLSQSVDSISNIQLVDFNANGGSLNADDFISLSFKSITVWNGNNAADRVKIVADGVANSTNGQKMPSSPATIDLEAITGGVPVSSFTLENGNIGNSKDRWNIESVEVVYTVQMPYEHETIFSSWLSAYGFKAEHTSPEADTENSGVGDGYPMLLEFALGMDPNVADAGSRESVFTAEDDGNSYFVYEYERRSDYEVRGLNYSLIVTPDLVTPSAEIPDRVTIGVPIDGYETITNSFLLDEPTKFIQLQVEMD